MKTSVMSPVDSRVLTMLSPSPPCGRVSTLTVMSGFFAVKSLARPARPSLTVVLRVVDEEGQRDLAAARRRRWSRDCRRCTRSGRASSPRRRRRPPSRGAGRCVFIDPPGSGARNLQVDAASRTVERSARPGRAEQRSHRVRGERLLQPVGELAGPVEGPSGSSARVRSGSGASSELASRAATVASSGDVGDGHGGRGDRVPASARGRAGRRTVGLGGQRRRRGARVGDVPLVRAVPDLAPARPRPGTCTVRGAPTGTVDARGANRPSARVPGHRRARRTA